MSKLKEIRLKRKIRPAELAKRLKISRASVCFSEKNGIRYTATAKKYAVVLDCKPEELLEF